MGLPMDIYEVNLASRARFKEVGQPWATAWGVCDGRRT